VGTHKFFTQVAQADVIGLTAALAAKARAVALDVRDFGAVGDGTADDTAAIQAAINALPVEGGRVVFPVGRFKVTAMLTVTNHCTVLEGVAPANEEDATHWIGGTRLEAGGTLSGNPMIRVQETANLQPLFGCSIRNITLDGMGVATGRGLHWRSYRSHLERVHVYRFATHGIHAEGYGGWDLYDSVLAYVQVSACGSAGLMLDVGASDLHLLHSVLFSCDVNLHIKSSSLQVTGCHFYDGRNNILFDGNGSRSKFTTCKIEGSNQHGVVLDTTNGGMSDIQFTGCNFSSNSDTTTNTYDQLIVQGPSGTGCSRVQLVGCAFTHKSGPLPRYHVNLGAASQSAVIVGNSLAGTDHYGTAAVNDASNASFPAYIAANGGYGPEVYRKWNAAPRTQTVSAATANVDVGSNADLQVTLNTVTATTLTPTGGVNGRTCAVEVFAATGATRTPTLASTVKLTDGVTSLALAIPASRVGVFLIRYSTLGALNQYELVGSYLRGA
jgi:hypothetical protein